MGYIFPLIKIIDTGAEEWLLPRELAAVKSLSLRGTHYFTFLPDFTPKAIYQIFDWIGIVVRAKRVANLQRTLYERVQQAA